MPLIEEGQSMDDLSGLLSGAKAGGGKEVDKEAAAADGSEGQDDKSGETPEADDGEPGNPEEGTDDGDADKGEPEEPADDEGAEPSTEPFYTVKVDGKDERVTLKEALAGYQRLQDYTRKTQEVATARQAANAERDQAQQQREAYAQVLNVIKDRIGPESGERTAEQWNALRTQDPAAYAAEWADAQRRSEQRRAVEAEKQRLASEQQADGVKRLREHIEGERAKLLVALPILTDKAKGPETIKAVRDFALARGFNEQEVNQLYDHRMFLLVNEARQWQDHQAALTRAKAKVKEAPTLPEPGARQPSVNPKSKARAEQMKTFKRTGKVDDAVALMLK